MSNQIESWMEPQLEQHRVRDAFDAVITSYGSRAAKPDKKIYLDACTALQASPSECVYIDDLEKNIPTAEALGMRTVLYRTLPQLKKDIAGILGTPFN
ncbi:MAG: HAD-IA family hydrolase [Patescibacteria group bacterium]